MPVWEYEYPIATVAIPLEDYNRMRDERAALKQYALALEARILTRAGYRAYEIEGVRREVGDLRTKHDVKALLEDAKGEVEP